MKAYSPQPSQLVNESKHPQDRRIFVQTLIQLARSLALGCYPESLVRDNMQLLGEESPIAAGSPRVPWKGNGSDGELVAVKILKVAILSDILYSTSFSDNYL